MTIIEYMYKNIHIRKLISISITSNNIILFFTVICSNDLELEIGKNIMDVQVRTFSVQKSTILIFSTFSVIKEV